jgi:RHS repeat-associated protein
LTVTDASDQTTTYTYSSTTGQLETVTTPPRAGITENRTTTYTYFPDHHLQSIQGPGGDLTQFTYDGYGRVRTMTPPEGDMLTYDYDDLDRVTRITFPDESYEENTYEDPAGGPGLDLVRQRDRQEHITTRVYDALRRLKEVHEDKLVTPGGGTGLDRTTTYAWCSCGSLNKITDPNGNETRWDLGPPGADQGRDLQGRVRFETRADGSVWEYTYESTTSRLKQRKDPKLQVANYEYFLDDKLKRVNYTNPQMPTPEVNYTYDPAYPRIATMTDGRGLTTYSYYPVSNPGQVIGATRLASVDGPLSSDLVAYTYDELGRIRNRGLSAAPTSFSYDAMGRVTVVGNGQGNFTYGFTGSSVRPQTLTYPGNGNVSYDSFIGDPRRGIKYNSITHRTGALTQLARFASYTYDLESNIESYSYRLGALVAPTKTYDPIVYDGLYQLTDATLTQTGGSPPPPVNYAYDYDLAGNRTSDGPPPVTSIYNNRNELTSRDGIAVTSDLNGNITGDGTRTFEWDAENRLTRVLVSGSEVARFVYDGLGRRAQKIAGGVTHDYISDEERLVEERVSGGPVLRFIDGPGVDQHLGRYVVGGSLTCFLTDHLGSVYRETNCSGSVTLDREYDLYGKPLAGGTTGGYAYTGREWDAETGLYYYRARYYDPKLGRFISEDPLGFELAPNLYSYAWNSPSKFTDPTGKVPAFFAGAALVIVVAGTVYLVWEVGHCYYEVTGCELAAEAECGALPAGLARRNCLIQKGKECTSKWAACMASAGLTRLCELPFHTLVD